MHILKFLRIITSNKKCEFFMLPSNVDNEASQDTVTRLDKVMYKK